MLLPVGRSLPPKCDLKVKHFFSGAAAYINGKICMSLTPVGLAMKLPEGDRNRLLGEGGKPLRYFPNGPVKKDYLVLPKAFLDDKRKCRRWARKSIDHVLILKVS